MIIDHGKREVGAWYIAFGSIDDIRYGQRGWRVFVFALAKIKALPEEGVQLNRKHYTGVIWKWGFWWPIARY